MTQRKLPEPVDDCDRKLLSDIERVGWHILNIEGDDEGPPYSFSVGFYHTLHHPEILIIGIPHETAVELLNTFGLLIKRGAKFKIGDQSLEIIQELPLAFTDVPTDCFREYLGYAVWFYQSVDFPVLQCVWPDKAGLFPWEAGYDNRLSQRQPVLADLE